MSDKSFTGLQLPNIGSGQARNPDSGFVRVYFKNNNMYTVLPDGTDTQVTGVGIDDLNNVVLTSPASGEVLKYNGTNWVNGTDDVVTNLGNTATGTSFTITSSTGSDTNLPAATTAAWGMMTDEDKTKLDGIEAGADVTDAGNVNPLVDAHLNTSTATNNQVLSWTGSDYDWVDQSAGGGASVTTSNTAPTPASDGDLWFNEEDGALYVYYEDGDSNQWVGVSGPQGPAGTPGTSGITTGKAIAMAIVFG